MSDVMEKVTVFLKINDYKLEKNGIFNNGILSLNDDDENQTEIIYDWNKDNLIRDNEDITIKFNFKENQVSYLLKKMNSKLQQKIDIIEFQKDKNKLRIKYKLEAETFCFDLSYEEVIL